MPPSRRTLQATVALTETPPVSLPETQVIAQIVKAEGNNLYSVVFSPSNTTNQATEANGANENVTNGTHDSDLQEQRVPSTALVELNSRFRGKIWLKRGGYVLVDRGAFAERENKLDGEIVNIVREEKEWMKQDYWPQEFKKRRPVLEDSDEEESVVGQMPPSESSGEDEEG